MFSRLFLGLLVSEQKIDIITINWTLKGAIISPDSILTTGDCCVANGLNNPNGDTTGVAGHLRFDRARSDGSVACGHVIDFSYEQELFVSIQALSWTKTILDFWLTVIKQNID